MKHGPGTVLAVTLACACGSAAPRPATPAPAPVATATGSAGALATDPDLSPPHTPKLVDVDWATVSVPDDAAAIALWHRIAPTGDDWERKLAEVPSDTPVSRALAVALLRGGQLACGPAPAHTHNCAGIPSDAADPAPTAGFDDPCLRRLLAMWAIGQLGDTEVAALRPELHAIAALPPPESELVAAAIEVVPETDQDERLAMLELAWNAGQHDVVDAELGRLDEAHLVDAAGRLHAPMVLEILSPDDHRDLFLRAIGDDKMPASGRIKALLELAEMAPALAADVHGALVAATRTTDCAVAAHAARELDGHGEHRYQPSRPRGTRTVAQLQRALCVLASYEQDQHADEQSLWPSFLPAHGVERVDVAYDALSDVDSDGDGDPHTTHTFEVEARRDAVLPEVDDLVRAMAHCTSDATSVSCASDTHAFKFVSSQEAGELVVRQLEVDEKPPCVDADVSP